MTIFTTPTLIGGISNVAPFSTNPDVDRLVREFGMFWKKTPHQGVWHIAKNGAQITIDHQDMIRVHQCPTVADFRKGFEKDVLRTVLAVPVDSFYKYPGLQVIELLKKLGLW